MRTYTSIFACCALLVATFAVITETARSPPASSGSSSSFHVLPVPPSVKLRASSSQPPTPYVNFVAPTTLNHEPSRNERPASLSHISGAFDFADSGPDPKAGGIDRTATNSFSGRVADDGSDDADLEGTVSRSFNPGRGSYEDFRAGGDFICWVW
jgi:hypothetical protein